MRPVYASTRKPEMIMVESENVDKGGENEDEDGGDTGAHHL